MLLARKQTATGAKKRGHYRGVHLSRLFVVLLLEICRNERVSTFSSRECDAAQNYERSSVTFSGRVGVAFNLIVQF